MDQVETGVVRSAADDRKCLSCGGEVSFDPQSQVLLCAYCGAKTEIEVEMKPVRDYDLEGADETANVNWGVLKRVFHCNNCGADSVIDGTTTTQFCAFCGSSHVVPYQEAAGMAPEGLVPFKVPKRTAEENFTTWIKKRRFAPGALRGNYRKHSVSGVYIPFWAFSADSESNYSADAGTHYNETEYVTVERDGRRVREPRQVQKTSWRRVNGNYLGSFRDKLINASRQIKGKIIGRIEPFRLQELVPYAPGFLAGFLAERYSLGLRDGWEEAKKSFDREIDGAVTRQIGADEVRNLSVNTRFSKRRYKLLLLPVWISSYTFKDKLYHFMVNGQTGKISGEAPVSAGRIVALVAGIVIVIAIIVLLVR